jgi:hypothetical protein
VKDCTKKSNNIGKKEEKIVPYCREEEWGNRRVKVKENLFEKNQTISVPKLINLITN